MKKTFKSIPRPGLNQPNQRNGSIEYFREGVGWQTADPSAAGEVLTVGSDGLPAFTAMAVFGNFKVTQFTSSGTWNRDANTIAVLAIVVGGGGGGGGASTDGSTVAGGGGGGGGGASERWMDAATAGASQSVTVGSAGSAGSSSGGNGGSGGTTSFGSLLSATGGSGGTGTGSSTSSSSSRAGGSGGSGSGGSFNYSGEDGWPSSEFAGEFGGKGGNAARGFGWGGRMTDRETGVAGTGRGAGGSGACSGASTNRAGGAGTAGYCLVVEFLKA